MYHPYYQFTSRDSVPQVLTGGHFGFDEEKRRRRFDSELSSEQARKNALLSAFGLLPEEEQEQIAATVEVQGKPDWQPVIEDPARYAFMLSRIESKLQLIQEEQELNELIQLGLL